MASINKKIKQHLPHKNLSSKLWDEEKKLKNEVKKKLLSIVEMFEEYLGVSIDIEDITITGSYANYNYTPYSDIDLHLIVNFNSLTKVKDLSKEFYSAKKSLWNDKHDIKIKGIEVEIYPQSKDEPHKSSGVYSVQNDSWIVEPKKFKTEVDIQSVRDKFKKIKVYLDNAISDAKKDEDYREVERAIKKIRKMRKSGLEKAGELSEENLVYKILRAEGVLQKLFDLKFDLVSKKYSI
tara:strand:+ start:2045 stop:2755 length:711 start_codon:yes stop_codon:yes gene_type:complete